VHPLLEGELSSARRIEQVIICQMRFVQLVEGEYNEVVLQIRTHTYRKSQQQPLCPHIRARTLEVDNAVEADVPEVLTGSDARVHEQRRAVVCTCRDDDLPARTEDVFRWRLRVGGLTSTLTAMAHGAAVGVARERMTRNARVEVRSVRLGIEVQQERKSALVGRGDE